ncbi:hypothetical protein NESM_000058200 [Novymonas esmeraldas]|uniref:Uncharacterized protein n=1 Tax=Novymonas esmeraldas TaxID=1808958 RepID=A0AAW0F2H3_9TRYP
MPPRRRTVPLRLSEDAPATTTAASGVVRTGSATASPSLQTPAPPPPLCTSTVWAKTPRLEASEGPPRRARRAGTATSSGDSPTCSGQGSSVARDAVAAVPRRAAAAEEASDSGSLRHGPHRPLERTRSAEPVPSLASGAAWASDADDELRRRTRPARPVPARVHQHARPSTGVRLSSRHSAPFEEPRRCSASGDVVLAQSASTPTTEVKADTVGERMCASPPLSSSSSSNSSSSSGDASAAGKIGRPRADLSSAEKPWLAAPPARGILKHGRHPSSKRPSTPRAPASARRSATPTTAVAGRAAAASVASSHTTAAGATHGPGRRPRHVTFNEAEIDYVEAAAAATSHAADDEGPVVGRRHNTGWAAATFCDTLAGYVEQRRQQLTGATALVEKDGADSWGADSEWFNEEFGAHLTPHAPRPTVEQAEPSEGTRLSTSTVIRRPPRMSLPPSSSAPPRLGGTRGRRRDVSGAADDYVTLGASVSSARSRTPQSARVCMNEHLVSVLSTTVAAAAVSSSSSSSITKRSSRDGSADDAGEQTSEDGRGSSPVLAYDHTPSAALPRSSAVANLSLRSPNSLAAPPPPPPPLSVNDLRRRSPVAPRPDMHGQGGPDHGDSHPRLMSPSVSLSNIEASLAAEVATDAGRQSTRLADRCEPVAQPQPTATPPLAAAAVNRESPTASATQLSASERRLLRAVMQVSARNHRATATTSAAWSRTGACVSPAITVETPCSTVSSSAGSGRVNSTSTSTLSSLGGSARLLRGGGRGGGAPRVQVLSADVRHFLNGGAPVASSARSGAESTGRTTSPPSHAAVSSAMRRRANSFTSHPHRHTLTLSAVHLAGHARDDDEDEMEPHIQVPLPTPRTLARKLSSAPLRPLTDRTA